MKRIDCIIPFCNGITNYYKSWANFLHGKKSEEAEKLNYVYVQNSLLAVIFLDIIYNKEKMVEKKEGCIYESKIYEEDLEELLNAFNDQNEREIFTNGADLLAFLRNKIAHGDLYIDSNNDEIIFFKDIQKIHISIDSFIKTYVDFSTYDILSFKQKTFTKEILMSKHSTELKKPIETEEELQLLLSLIRLKKYTLKRLDGKELTQEEIIEFCKFLNFNQIRKLDMSIEEYERKLKEYYEKKGYVVDITKQKIKNSDKIDKIRKSVKANTDIYKKNILNENISLLIYKYEDDIYKIIREDYNKFGMNIGIKINELILREMYINKNYDLENVIEKIKFQYSIGEIVTAIDLARFYTLYCYPLEKIYTKDHNYHYNRDNEFRFDLLDLSEFNPSVLNINENGKIKAEENIKLLIKKINSLEEKIQRIEGYISGMSKKNNINEKTRLKLEEFKRVLSFDEKKLSKFYELYFEICDYRNMVIKDYEENYIYFRNRRIIEGMRDAISHGNVTIEEIGVDDCVSYIKIKFSDVYEGNLEFELDTNLYSLENLFEEENLIKNNMFVYMKQIENKYNK